ncbi:glucose-6-phosphate isomerase [Ferroacidibacillus organovorans]|uniref:Glucose-6-phosphate isomerase n=3 Tax=Ferroacidibacillus organovorans TaxID=1765683 RepID=A0A1V4ERI3_9BACL|nr:glucose-6-phosphate isomerase [Ferroacidibacillus organovorans]OPG15545.1 glucose-6-phosphate isomerase [Ferroacidibacillus organovorans]
MRLRLSHRAQPFVSERELMNMQPFIDAAHQLVTQRSGVGRDFLGWIDLPDQQSTEMIAAMKKKASEIAQKANVLVVIGIGGSYLGTRAALHLLGHAVPELAAPSLRVVYAGHNMSATYLSELLADLDRYDVAVNVISKSGTTTEPALAFRFLQAYMEKRYGKEDAATRIVATTDRANGALVAMARASAYATFVIPDDVGGRYSVLTPVGLFPLAVAGVDIDALLAGARRAKQELSESDVSKNDAYAYAALRNILLRKGCAIEAFVSYEPGIHYIAEWWKQLFGESEGKDGRGLFPTSLDFSTDLHSMGQYVQEGARILFESVVRVKSPRHALTIPELASDADGLNYLAGQSVQHVNDTALRATMLAHEDGRVPQVLFEMDDMSEQSLGYLFYFFELSCAISGYLLGVNPFDQPGVEAYKKNMFALLGKPGFEAERARLLSAREETRNARE